MNRCHSVGTETGPMGRRKFLTLGMLGGGASVLALTLPAGTSRAAARTDALLLSCMDFRLVHATERYMADRGLRDKYDHIVLAGASLGAVTDRFPAWNTSFWQHLDIAIRLHQIHTVIVLDHRDCGAYSVILGEDFSKDRAREMSVHAGKLRELRQQIHAKYPTLKIELLLMSLDGTVEKIA